MSTSPLAAFRRPEIRLQKYLVMVMLFVNLKGGGENMEIVATIVMPVIVLVADKLFDYLRDKRKEKKDNRLSSQPKLRKK